MPRPPPAYLPILHSPEPAPTSTSPRKSMLASRPKKADKPEKAERAAKPSRAAALLDAEPPHGHATPLPHGGSIPRRDGRGGHEGERKAPAPDQGKSRPDGGCSNNHSSPIWFGNGLSGLDCAMYPGLFVWMFGHRTRFLGWNFFLSLVFCSWTLFLLHDHFIRLHDSYRFCMLAPCIS